MLICICFFSGYNLLAYGQDVKFPLPDSSNATLKETLEWLKEKFDGISGLSSHKNYITQSFTYDLTEKKIIITQINKEGKCKWTFVYKIPISSINGASLNIFKNIKYNEIYYRYDIFCESKIIQCKCSLYCDDGSGSSSNSNSNSTSLIYPNLDENMANRFNKAFNHIYNLCKKSEKF